MIPSTLTLWMLPAHLLQWSGASLAVGAMFLLLDLAYEHWRAGHSATPKGGRLTPGGQQAESGDHDIEEDSP